tara:strand:+ start:568 stop:744 length:177 start_codon:yes stop_codon:yes gene_type:complete
MYEEALMRANGYLRLISKPVEADIIAQVLAKQVGLDRGDIMTLNVSPRSNPKGKEDGQ